jgi:acylphosphatase
MNGAVRNARGSNAKNGNASDRNPFPPSRLSAFPPSSFAALLSSPVRLARRYVISGRVQGVGFRYFADAVAAREGLHGWVRNLPGGSVEALAEGDAEAVERFERAIRHGPPGARVDHVDVESTVPSGRDSGFTVA